MGHDSKERYPDQDVNAFGGFINFCYNIVDTPVVWFREKVVEPNRKDYNWYHRVYRRVPTIDECGLDDRVCMFEAEQQFKRDKKVDSAIMHALRIRVEECIHYETPDHKIKCQPLQDTYQEAVDNWFTKYGDLGAIGGAREALTKQKHRMIWERRYGPVGTGMNRIDGN